MLSRVSQHSATSRAGLVKLLLWNFTWAVGIKETMSDTKQSTVDYIKNNNEIIGQYIRERLSWDEKPTIKPTHLLALVLMYCLPSIFSLINSQHVIPLVHAGWREPWGRQDTVRVQHLHIQVVIDEVHNTQSCKHHAELSSLCLQEPTWFWKSQEQMQ